MQIDYREVEDTVRLRVDWAGTQFLTSCECRCPRRELETSSRNFHGNFLPDCSFDSKKWSTACPLSLGTRAVSMPCRRLLTR